MMKCLLVLGLLQGAAGQTTGAPTPSPTPSPTPPVPASHPATVTGSVGTNFGDCPNAAACITHKDKCETSAKAAMAAHTAGVTTSSFSSFSASRPDANTCRRLSETEIDKILSQADIRIDDPRRLSSANNGVINFAYTITATAGTMSQIQTATAALGTTSKSVFTSALQTQLSNSGVPALATASSSVSVSSVSATAAVSPTPAPTTTPSVVSATVGSQVALSALAALVGFLW